MIYPRLKLDISFKDLFTALGFLTYLPPPSPPAMLQKFAQGDKQVKITLSVRTAFDLLLQALQLPPGSEVLMTAINIPDMVEIVKQNGLVPVPVDLDLATMGPKKLEAYLSPRTKLLVVAHLFGVVVDLKPIAAFCRTHDLLLVEDCAQAFCGTQYCGHPEADVSLFSFGPIKSCTALAGAIAAIKNQQVAEKMTAIEQQYPTQSQAWFFLRVLKFCYLKLISHPAIYGFVLTLMGKLVKDLDATLYSLTRGFGSSGDQILSKIRYRPPQGLVALLYYRLHHVQDEQFQRRIVRGRQFLTLLSPDVEVPATQADFNSYWVISVLSEQRDFLVSRLRAAGFDATRGTTSVVTTVGSPNSPSEQNSIQPKEAERFTQQVVFLPLSGDLPDDQFPEVAALVNRYAVAKLAQTVS